MIKRKIKINTRAKREIDRYPMVAIYWLDICSDSSWQSLEGCKISPRLHNGTCNTAFENLGVIVLNVIIFGYHSGTQNTPNSD